MRSPIEDDGGFTFRSSVIDQADELIHSNSLASYLIFVACIAVLAYILI